MKKSLFLLSIAFIAATSCLELPRDALAATRTRLDLSDNWHIKQLENACPDIDTLGLQALKPDSSWLKARMPAQIHDILLSHGIIADPRIGKNASKCTWVGKKDWVYSHVFLSPKVMEAPYYSVLMGWIH